MMNNDNAAAASFESNAGAIYGMPTAQVDDANTARRRRGKKTQAGGDCR